MAETIVTRGIVADDETLGELFHRLAQDGKTYALAEVNAAKAQATAKVAGLKVAAVMFVVALLLVIGAVVTLLVGFAMGLAPYVGPAGAGAIVAVGALAVAGLLGWLGARSIAGQTS